jgi:hypothetical protein
MAAASGRDRCAGACAFLLLLLGLGVAAGAETTEAIAAVDPNQERRILLLRACYSLSFTGSLSGMEGSRKPGTRCAVNS